MDETQLRELLRAALDDANPPADLYDRGMHDQPARRRRTPWRTLVGVASLVVIMLVVALVVDATHGRDHVHVVETPTTIAPDLAATTSVNPINDFIEQHELGATYRIAVENSVARCMHALSWSYVPRVANLTNVYGAGNGPTDPDALLAYRAKYGYGYLIPTPGHPEKEAAIDELNSGYFWSLAPQAQLRYTRDLGRGPDERYFGTTTAPDSGCRGRAEAAERKVIPRVSHVVQQDLGRRQNDVQSDPAYLAAQAKWSSCMADAGFHFVRATDAQASISNLFAPPANDPNSQDSAKAQADAESLRRAQALERRTGAADARCAAPTVWPVQRRLELAILQDVIDTYGRDVLCGASCTAEPGR